MVKTILSVQNLCVDLGEHTILSDISFKLKKGEMMIILGPNGAGKSVLLRTLLGVHPFKGKIIWTEDIHVGFLPCDFVPPTDLPLTVEDFFSFKKIKGKSVAKQFKKINMDVSSDFLKKNISELSTGQLRRVLISWVLADNPDVILFDEPFSHIDSKGRNEIFNSLLKLCKHKGISIILVSHDISKSFENADGILAINRKIIFNDKPSEVLNPNNLLKIYASDNL